MIKENAKLQKKMQRQERARILKLVELARGVDPRLRAANAEKQRKKQEKQQAKQKEQQEQRELLEQQAKRKEEEAARALTEARRAQQQAVERAARNQKNLRRACEDAAMSPEHTECLIMSLNNEDIESALASPDVGAELSARVSVFVEKRERLQREEAQRKAEARRLREQQERELREEDEYSTSELGVLATTLNAIPGGVEDRWPRVMKELKRADPSWSRSIASVQRKALELKRGIVRKVEKKYAPEKSQIKSAPSVNWRMALEEPEEWTPQQQKELEMGIRKHGKGDFQLVAQGVSGKNASQCEKRFGELVRQIKEKKMAAAKLKAHQWEKPEQKALQGAMRKLGKNEEGHYEWDKVAQLVDGRNKFECEARFLHLREKARAK